MAEFYFDNLAKNLPDAYQKHAKFRCSACGNVWSSPNRQCPKCADMDSEIERENTSNNFKILEIERTANNDLRSILADIQSILDINNATGATLDMYGEKYGQARGKASDAQYRIMIQSRINRNWCNGSYKNIVDAISLTFGCSINDILLEETSPMVIEVKNLELSKVEEAGFETNQVYQIIKSLLPTATELQSVFIDGTFMFGEDEDEEDENAGFAISEDDQSVGGYFGILQTSENSVDLPI